MHARRPRWLWSDRWPMGEVSLLAGKGGLGKSTICYWAAARVTRGELPGEHFGTPRPVLVCATEDSWEHTIVPRLIAADADLDLIFSVEVIERDADGEYESWLSLPSDIPAVDQVARRTGAGLMLLDPLMSRLNSGLDTHRDADVRRALEPLKRLAASADMAVVGLIHVNKGSSADPLGAVMGSAGFVNVARSVSVVVSDPSDDTERRRLFGTPKNNLGRDDLPTLAYQVVGVDVPTEDGTASTGAIEWQGETSGTIREAMAAALTDEGTRSAVGEAGEWLVDWLSSEGGEAPRQDVELYGRKAGHSIDALKRARTRVGVQARNEGFPRRSVWFLSPEGLIDGRSRAEQSVQSVQSGQSVQGPTTRSNSAVGGSSAPIAPTAPTAPTGSDLLFRDANPAPTEVIDLTQYRQHDGSIE